MTEQGTGHRPLFCVSQLFLKRHLDQAPDIKQGYDLWVARYGDFKPDGHVRGSTATWTSTNGTAARRVSDNGGAERMMEEAVGI